jgi:thioredoxin reductase
MIGLFDCDLLIVGAGPAGMAAALTAHEAGLSVVVADEGQGGGGQVYRSVLNGPLVTSPALGNDYIAGAMLAKAFSESSIQHVSAATVFMVESSPDRDGFHVGVSRNGKAQLYHARTVLMATGALERPFPIPGWTLPGVMTAGAAQTLLKASGVVPEGPTYLAGTGPLLYLLAAQYARAGVPVEAILDTTPSSNWLGSLRHLPDFLASSYFFKGLGLLREIMASTRIVRGITSLEARGEGALASVRWIAKGTSSECPAQTLLLHQGVVPQVNLAMAAGVKHSWNTERLAFEPELDLSGRTSVQGVYLAGDSAGIAGADAAQHRGVLAAIAISEDLGLSIKTDLKQGAARGLSKATRGRRFLDTLYRPADAFRMPKDDVIICRCEEVTAGEIRALTQRGAQGPNQAKAFSRAGMGPCQGRLCGLTVCEIMAASSGRNPNEIGHIRIRTPVKPVSVAEIASLSQSSN